MSNPDHVEFWNVVFDSLNFRLANLKEQSCFCTASPTHYTNIHLEFVPNYVEIQDNYGWDHSNDLDQTNTFSGTKAYLDYINDLVESQPGHEPGFDVHITTEGPIWDAYVANNGTLPIWDLGYESDYGGVWYSDFPTYDLDKPAFWHAPDLYLWYQNASDHLASNNIEVEYLPFVAKSFLHEYGHYLGLIHRDACDINIMQKASGKRYSFCGCQVRTIYKAIMAQNIRKYVICEELEDYLIVVDSDEKWKNKMRVFGDIIIEENASLTITCELQMPENKRIIVQRGGKLIVDGGLINGCGEYWGGIHVEGGNVDFDVRLSDAIIEDAKTAVSMYPPNISWPLVTAYGNGILLAETSTFNDCDRIAEFFAFKPSQNHSQISGCTMNGGKHAVTNWNCHGIDVSDSYFYDIKVNSIQTINGSFDITGNEFHSAEQDIVILDVYTGISSWIQDNKFYGDNIGLLADGTSYAPNYIFNNDFQTGQIDVFMDGINHFFIEKNDFSAPKGAVSVSGGNNPNRIDLNTFDNNITGIFTQDKNFELSFQGNCFQTTDFDAYIDGSITDFIGSPELEAGNCFTHGTTADIGGDMQFFTYYLFEDNEVNCKDVLNQGNFDVSPLTFPNNDYVQCGSELPNSPVPTWDICNPERNLSEANTAFQQVQVLLNNIPNDLNLTEDEKIALLDKYTRCLNRVRGILAELLLESEDLVSLRALYASEDTFDARIATFSSYLFENDLTSAETYLSSMIVNGEEESDFKFVQGLYLDRLNQGPSYNLSVVDEESLYTIALKSHPYAAYGRSLYYFLSGQLVISELVEQQQGGEFRSAVNATGMPHIHLYPNPSNSNIIVKTVGYEQLGVVVLSMQGKEMLAISDALQKNVISTGDWPQGVYIVEVREKGKLVYKEKLVINK